MTPARALSESRSEIQETRRSDLRLLLVLCVQHPDNAPLRLLPVGFKGVPEEEERAGEAAQVGNLPDAVLAPGAALPGAHLLREHPYGRPGPGQGAPRGSRTGNGMGKGRLKSGGEKGLISGIEKRTDERDRKAYG